MVKFNELAIKSNGEILVIDASVLDLPYYNNVYISKVLVDTQDTYINGHPSTQAIEVFSTNENTKHIKVELNKGNFLPSISNNMFFVYVQIKGIPSSDTPCGMDNEYTLGITFDFCPIYNNIMQSLRDNLNDCEIPREFIDKYLRFKSIEYSISTNHYTEAINYYNRFFKNKLRNNITYKPCNCHG